MSPVKLREKIQQFLEKITYKQLVGLAVVFSFLMGLLVYVGLSGDDSKQQQQAAPAVQTVQVVVAAQDIPERTVVTDNMVKVIDMPEDLVPEGAYTTLSDVINHPTSTSVAQGDVMSDKKVYADIRMAGFSGSIPPNCRAITIGISDITGIAGFAKPGDYVDIMLVRNDTQDGMVKSEVLLQNVLLLAVNKDAAGNGTAASSSGAEDSNGNGDSSQSQQSAPAQPATASSTNVNMTSVTLALPMDQAIRVAAASQAGTLYLVLRPVAPEEKVTPNFSYEMQSQQGTPQQQAPAPQEPPAQPSAPAVAPAPQQTQQSSPVPQDNVFSRSIEIIRGTQSSRVGVN